MSRETRCLAEAVKCYSQAIAGAEHDETLFANRSASYLAQQLFDEAVTDAAKTVQLKETWPKGHYRCSSATVFTCTDYMSSCMHPHAPCMHSIMFLRH